MGLEDPTQQIVIDTDHPIESRKSVKVSLSLTALNWNLGKHEFSMGLDTIIGACHIHTPASESKFCIGVCKKSYSVLKASQLISQAPTGYWSVFGFQIEKNRRGDIESSHLREVRFYSTQGDQNAVRCVDAIQKALAYNVEQKKLLMILNPFSGTKKAMKVFNKIVLPMLKIAGQEKFVELVKTSHSNHAAEITQSLEIDEYKSLSTISGDGVFHEALNGLLSRPDWKKAIQLPIGCIGSGSANGIGKNLDTIDKALATLNVLKCKTRKMDVFVAIQKDTVLYSHLSVSWAFIADVDIESEKFRYLGEHRLILMAIIRIIKFRNYRGRLYLLPESESLQYELSEYQRGKMVGPVPKFIAPKSDNYKNWPIKLDSIFQFFLASNVPWISSDFLAAPTTKMDDGLIQVIYSEKMNRSSVLACILDQGRGMNMTFDFISHLKVKAFVIEPLEIVKSDGTPELQPSEELILAVSGERIPYLPIQVEIIPQLVNLICPTWLDADRWMKNFYREFSRALNQNGLL